MLGLAGEATNLGYIPIELPVAVVQEMWIPVGWLMLVFFVGMVGVSRKVEGL